MTEVTRRAFLSSTSGLIAAGTAATLIPARAESQGAASTGSQPGYRLTADWLETELDGTRVKLRAWNGTVPGPVLEARPGDTMEVEVVNKLTAYDSSGWGGDHNVPHELNTTNLHVHGIEVAPHLFEPLGTSDPLAPMIEIPPEGGSKTYSFAIPPDQPPGLFWYHPHKHGATAVQAASGMAGVIVIRGDIDEVPEIAAAREFVLAVQDIGLFPTDNPQVDGADTYIYEPKQNAMWQTFSFDAEGNPAPKQVTINGVTQPELNGGYTTGDYALRYYLINGAPFYKEVHNPDDPMAPIGTQLEVPTLNLAPGEVARFRMLNANSDNLMPIYLEGHDLHLIGMDGINLPKLRTRSALPEGAPETDHQLLLAPANRGEFLVKAAITPGTYQLVQAPQSLQFLKSGRRVLANVVVSGDARDMALPGALPVQARHFPAIPDAEVMKTRTIEFGMQFPARGNPVVGVDFLLNRQLYDALTVATTVMVGDVEDWIIQSPAHPPATDEMHACGHQANTEGHPFHLHMNSFEVIAIADINPDGSAGNETRFTEDEILVQDTVWVPMGKQVTIRVRFKDWIGKAVYHCHILPHEDTGMMQNMLVLDPALYRNHAAHLAANKG